MINKKKTKNTKRGITLISLVITIILLLILAAVAINLAADSDGVFEKAEQAADNWNETVKEEKEETGSLLDKLDEIQPTQVTVSTTLPEGWNKEEIAGVATGLNKQVPIPEGFVASSVEGENTIVGGFVIYRKENGITEVTEANHSQALTSCDQYVWIPVDDINDMVMCKNNAAGSICNLIQESNGDLKCTTHNSKDLAGRLLYYEDSDNYVEEGTRLYIYM